MPHRSGISDIFVTVCKHPLIRQAEIKNFEGQAGRPDLQHPLLYFIKIINIEDPAKKQTNQKNRVFYFS